MPYQSLGAATLTATSTQREEVVVNIKYLPKAGEPAFSASNLTFKLGTTAVSGTPTAITTTTGYTASFLFNLPSVPITGTSGDEPFLYAYYGTGATAKKIGKINIAPFKRREEKVILVPVNGATAPSVVVLQTYLDSVYRQANVKFTVTESDDFTFNLDTNNVAGLERGGDGINKYSAEMRMLRDKFATDSTYDKKASYIFVIPAFEGGGLDGFMVRGRSMGFIRTGAVLRTYAHELGHGIFGLEHTFPEIAQSLSNNLMDYGDSTHLTHKQCKDISKRKFVFSWLDSEEDGSFANIVIGAVAGGLVDLLIQIIEIYINEDAKGISASSVSISTVVNKISWSSVGLSVAFGAAGNVAGIGAKFKNFASTPGGKKVAKLAVDAMADVILDASEDIIKEYVATGEVKNVAETLISSALFSGAGGLLDGVATKIRKRFGIKEVAIPRLASVAKKIDKPVINLQKVRLDAFIAKIPNKVHADAVKKYLDASYLPERGFIAINDELHKWLGNSKLVALLADWNYYAAFYQTIGSPKYKLKIGPTGTVEELILWIIGLKEFKATRDLATIAGMPDADIDDAIDELCSIPSLNTRVWQNNQLSVYTPMQVRSFLEHVLTTNNNIAVVNQAEAESNPVTAPFVHAFTNDAEKTNINTWLRGMNDNRLYVALHGQGSKLFVSRSSTLANGSVVSVPLTTRSLARWIKGFGTPASTEIVLLSCASEQAAQNLVNKLGGAYRVVSWTGEVRVYNNGFINGDGDCKRYSPATSSGINAVVLSGSDIPKGKATSGSGAVVVLAKPVPVSLATKITTAGETLLLAWMVDNKPTYKDPVNGSILTGDDAEEQIFEKLNDLIGSKTVLETFVDAQKRFLVKTDATPK